MAASKPSTPRASVRAQTMNPPPSPPHPPRHVVAGLGGPLDLLAHVVDRHQRLAVEVAAALGEDLVLDVQARRAGAGVLDDGAADHLRLAEAGVGVGEDGEAGGIRHLADDAAEVLEAEEPDVGDAGGDARRGAGDVARGEACFRDGAGAEAVERAGRGDDAAVHQVPELLARLHAAESDRIVHGGW
jgi:hypothetical protein